MKRLGLIGGTTWLSTVQYYTRLNQIAAQERPGHTASLLLWNTEWSAFQQMDWEQRYDHHLQAARALHQAGAEALLICANTLHRFQPRLEADQPLPIVSILDAIASEVASNGWQKAAILGTKVTMTEPFYAGRLAQLGVQTIVPSEQDMDEIDRTIFEEFANDCFLPKTADNYLRIIEVLKTQGADCAILGCTEIPLLLSGRTAAVPMIDTIEVHCRAAIRYALQ